jgi:hypothetical protein
VLTSVVVAGAMRAVGLKPARAPRRCGRPMRRERPMRRATTRVASLSSSSSSPSSGESTTVDRVRVMTFNVLCPEYKRVDGGGRESDDVDAAMERQGRILDLIASDAPDVLCVQEFWHADEKVRGLWLERLEKGGYEVRWTPRTGGRCDGLLTAVQRETLEVVDSQDVLFNDCGDRVANVTRVKRGNLEAMVVNIHLLFPHNENSSLIRLREIFQTLEHLNQMMKADGLRGRKIPIIMTGDFNGTSGANGEGQGRVYRFLTSQGFVNALDDCQRRQGCSTNWVSHMSHRKIPVGVDHMFLLNPSSQVTELGASWQEAVFAMMRAKIVASNLKDDLAAFEAVDENADGGLTKEEFIEFANKIGLCGETSPGLLTAELEALYSACDKDGNGLIDFQEFVERMDIRGMADAIADPNLSLDISDFMASSASDKVVLQPLTESWDQETWEEGDLAIECAKLPDCMLRGEWPDVVEYNISDHGPLVGTFKLKQFA